MKEGIKKELGTGRVAFLARLDEIKKEVETGRTVISVYREYQKQIGISYSQFDRYVNKFIKEKDNGRSDRKSANETEKGKGIPRKEARTRTAEQPAFVSSDEPRSKDELM